MIHSGKNIFAMMAALVFALVAGAACEEAGRSTSPAPNADWLARLPAWPACAPAAWQLRWYQLRIQGQPAGSEQQRICARLTDGRPGKLFEARGQYAFTRDGVRLEHLVQTRFWLDAGGHLVRCSYRTSQPGQAGQHLEAGRIDEELVAIRGPELRRSAWEGQALAGPEFQNYLWGRTRPQPGQHSAFRSFSTRTAGYVDNTVEIVGPAPQAPGRTVIKRRSSDAPSVTAWLTLAPDGTLAAERADFGQVRIESLRMPSAPGRAIPAKLPDLTEHMRIKTLGRFPEPHRVVRARYQLSGLPDHVDGTTLTGPGQKVTQTTDAGIVIVVKRIQARPGPLPPSRLPPDHQRWLRSTGLAQADDARIKALAARLTRGQPDSLAAALSLRKWVAEEISGDMGMTFASATDVLAAGQGDCSEKAVLLVALARAAGLPARAVAGLVYNDGAFAGHMWTEIWLGDAWLPLDAAWGPVQVSAARIRLGVDPLELGDEDAQATARLVVMVSGVKVTILDAAK